MSMNEYKPPLPFTAPVYLLIPTSIKKVKGVLVKEYPEPSDDMIIFCSFRTFGGTEVQSNGIYTVLDTANIETWYRPDITADCRICLAEQPDKVYDIIGTPENINMRNQFLKFKVQAVGGGA